MLRGEFRFQNGLIIPNNVTIVGAGNILAAALRNTAIEFWVGLCSGVYEPDLTIQDLVEPTIGVNGYERLVITRDGTGWPVTGVVNGENFFESLPLIWEAVGGPFDEEVTRMFISQEESATSGDVIAISAALPDDLLIEADTPEVDRTFKYRLYLR